MSRNGQVPLTHLLRRTVGVLAPRRAVRSRGLRFTLQADNWITHFRWHSYNTKEPGTLDWIDTWPPGVATFFDVGANIGLYTIYAALRHPRARIIAFEPEYANLHLFRDNIIKNGLQDRVEVYSIALSHQTGLSRLQIQDFTPGAALHTEARETLRVTREQQPVVWREGIATFTLDDFCTQQGVQPNYLKIDVDGTEPEILEGGRRTLCSPTLHSLLIEMPAGEPARQRCEELLCGVGLRREGQGSQGGKPNEMWVRNTA